MANDSIYDLIVVGAGPAGSSAARVAANSGLRTLLIDKDRFPRYKTCGGGLIGVTTRTIPPNPPVREDIMLSTFTLAGRYERTRHAATQPMIKTVVRSEFDGWLADIAQQAGVEFLDKTKVTEISEDPDVVAVTTDQGSFRGRFLIGADGTSSRAARLVGVRLRQVDLGLELELTKADTRWDQRIHLDWGPLPGSYGWLFPKGDSLTVGVIAEKGRPRETREYLKSFLGQLNLASSSVIRESGHLTQCRDDESPLARGRIFLVGDAAGLLEPWTREGISFAVRSGEAAALEVAAGIAGDIHPDSMAVKYKKRLDASITAEMAAGSRALAAFSKHPEVFHGLIAGTPIGWKYFQRITTGDTNIARAWRHPSVRLGLKILHGGSFESADSADS